MQKNTPHSSFYTQLNFGKATQLKSNKFPLNSLKSNTNRLNTTPAICTQLTQAKGTQLNSCNLRTQHVLQGMRCAEHRTHSEPTSNLQRTRIQQVVSPVCGCCLIQPPAWCSLQIMRVAVQVRCNLQLECDSTWCWLNKFITDALINGRKESRESEDDGGRGFKRVEVLLSALKEWTEIRISVINASN